MGDVPWEKTCGQERHLSVTSLEGYSMDRAPKTQLSLGHVASAAKRSVGPGLAPPECLVAIRVGPDFTCAVMQTGKVTSEVRGWPRTQRWSMKVEQLLS